MGKGLHARKPLERGEVVMAAWGTLGPERTRYTIQIDRDTHLTVETELRLINHSCEPNCGLLIRTGVPILELHALRSVEPGEELTVDYASFEDDIQFMTGPCLCGSPICRGRVSGYADLPADRRAALGAYIAEHLQKLDQGCENLSRKRVSREGEAPAEPREPWNSARPEPRPPFWDRL